jgi:hypothetical protein
MSEGLEQSSDIGADGEEHGSGSERTQETWTQISPWCLRCGDYTIVKVGSSRGWRYELWLKQTQLLVDLLSAQHAMDERRKVITGI